MEVKEEYRGKIIYQNEDTKKHLAINVRRALRNR